MVPWRWPFCTHCVLRSQQTPLALCYSGHFADRAELGIFQITPICFEWRFKNCVDFLTPPFAPVKCFFCFVSALRPGLLRQGPEPHCSEDQSTVELIFSRRSLSGSLYVTSFSSTDPLCSSHAMRLHLRPLFTLRVTDSLFVMVIFQSSAEAGVPDICLNNEVNRSVPLFFWVTVAHAGSESRGDSDDSAQLGNAARGYMLRCKGCWLVVSAEELGPPQAIARTRLYGTRRSVR